MIEYLFKCKRCWSTFGVLIRRGAADERISSGLDNDRPTLARARAIAGQWNIDRHAGGDPIPEREARRAPLRAVEEAQRIASVRESVQFTVRELVDHFAAKHLAKKGGPAMRYRLCPGTSISGPQRQFG